MYSPTVLDALVECLRTAYFYKTDLKSFLRRAGVPGDLVSHADWSYKVRAAREIVDELVSRPETGMPVLEKLVDSVVELDEGFPRLRNATGAEQLVQDARSALQNLKEVLGRESIAERAERARRESRTEAHRQAEIVRERKRTLAGLQVVFNELLSMPDVRSRGTSFEAFLRDLFQLFDLEPRGSMARPGEQTDGSIRIGDVLLLVEAKWTKELTEPKEVRDFRSKVRDRLDNTLGLFVSVNGFTDNAIAVAESGGERMSIILADGVDLAPVLDGQVDLVELLRFKLRQAGDRGQALSRFSYR